MINNLDHVRAEHAEILAIALEIRHLLDPAALAPKATMLQGLVNDLTRRTLAHLLLEDRCLYQEMLLSEHDETRALVQQYIDCMGNTAKDLQGYVQNWQSAKEIADKPENFCDDTRRLLDALEARIYREEQQLYPKAEQA